MKRNSPINLVGIILGVMLIFSACTDERYLQEKNLQEEQLTESQIKSIDVQNELVELNTFIAKKVESAKNSQLKDAHDCLSTATVPGDFATIQEALDAVCDEGDVIVKEGDYEEELLIYKPGIHLKAIGEVKIIGSIALSPDASGSIVQGFYIDVAGTHGITGAWFNDVKIMDNTISATEPSGIGIRLFNTSNTHIRNNSVSGMDWGIFIGASGGQESDNNTISDNTVTDIQVASVIGLQGDCDNNLISGNTLYDNLNPSNAGIMLYSWDTPESSCNNNVIKNNNVTNTNTSVAVGVWVAGASSDNVVGPNNVANSNTWGIVVTAIASGNHIFKNTALNNTEYDLFDEGSEDNTYKNNEYETFFTGL